MELSVCLRCGISRKLVHTVALTGILCGNHAVGNKLRLSSPRHPVHQGDCSECLLDQ